MKKIIIFGFGIVYSFVASTQCQNSSFNGLEAVYSCPTSSFLNGVPTGGVFSGPGVVGDVFDPSVAGVGTHVISYTGTASSPTAGYGVTEGLTNNPYAGPFTSVTLGDDQMSTALEVGFTFNFFGTDYTQFLISSNGFISFDLAAGNGCCSGQMLPDAFDPNNIISFAWNDLNPSMGGTIGYTTIGTAPNRILVIDYNAIPHYGGGGTPITVQAMLYEGTNIIEIHSTNNVTDGTGQTLGVENASGTCGITASSTNSNPTFSLLNTMISFAPQAATYYSSMTGLTNAPYAGTLTSVTLPNDGLSALLPIGFSFDFFGTNYTDFKISSNGFLTFDQVSMNTGTTAQSLPDPTDPSNIVAFSWADLDPSLGGTIGYSTIGIAPNRILVVDFTNIQHNGGGTPVTAQVKIYETSNIIEIHSTQNAANGTAQTMGLENIGATDAVSPSGRNANTAFSVVNEMTIFYPYYTSIQITNVASITDVQAPIPFNLILNDINSQCGVDFLDEQYADDNCAGFIVATNDAILPITASTTVTYSYDDGNGNIYTQLLNIIVNDNIAPVVAAFEIRIIVGATYMDDAMWTLTDNGGTVVASGGPYTSGPMGSIIDTQFADGVNGPYTFYGTTIGVFNDNVMNYEIYCSGSLVASGVVLAATDVTTSGIETCNPLADIVSQCGDVTELEPVTAGDNCAGTINGTNDAVFPISTPTVVTWTFDDGNGNVSTYPQNVTVTGDITAPIPDEPVLSDVVVYCGQVNSLITPTSTDNCGATVMGFNTVFFPITESTDVTWSYNDGNGNVSSQIQSVIITTLNPTLSLSGISLSVTNDIAGNTYQWIDCSNDQWIDGEVSMSYTPSATTGNYAVIAMNGACSDTSDCMFVDYSKIDEISAGLFQVYPNPSTATFYIESSISGKIEMLDVSGRVIRIETAVEGKNEINVGNLSNGTYTLKFTSSKGVHTERLIINRQ